MTIYFQPPTRPLSRCITSSAYTLANSYMVVIITTIICASGRHVSTARDGSQPCRTHDSCDSKAPASIDIDLVCSKMLDYRIISIVTR